jgi:hypothetical protein
MFLLSLFSNGPNDISQILIAIYKTSGEIRNRQKLTQKLYRMKRKGILEQVGERKGMFQLKCNENET